MDQHWRLSTRLLVMTNLTRRYQMGSSTVEYVIGAIAVIASLFMPIPVIDASLINVFLGALKEFQDNSTYLISLP